MKIRRISKSSLNRTLRRNSSSLTNKTFRVNSPLSRLSKLAPAPSTMTCPSLRLLTRIKLLPMKAKKSPCPLRAIPPPITPRSPPRSKRRKRSMCLFLRKQNRESAMPRKSPPPLLQGAGTLCTQSQALTLPRTTFKLWAL